MDYRSQSRPYTEVLMSTECELLCKPSTKESVKKTVDGLYSSLKTELDNYFSGYERLNQTIHFFESPAALVAGCTDTDSVIGNTEFCIQKEIGSILQLINKDIYIDYYPLLGEGGLSETKKRLKWTTCPSNLTRELCDSLWNSLDDSREPDDVHGKIQTYRHSVFLREWLVYKNSPINSELIDNLAKIGAFTWFSRDSAWVSENPISVKVGFKYIDLTFKDGWQFCFELPEKFQDVMEREFTAAN